MKNEILLARLCLAHEKKWAQAILQKVINGNWDRHCSTEDV